MAAKAMATKSGRRSVWRPKTWGRRQRLALMVTSVVVVVGVATAFAVVSNGYHGARVSASTSTVWVTNDADSTVGRINLQVNQLNSAFDGSSAFDVLQQDDQVVEIDSAKHYLNFVDDALVATSAHVPLPARAQVAFGGGVASILDQDTGKWWLGTQDSLSSFDPASTPAALTTGKSAVAAVSQDGHLFAVLPGSKNLWEVTLSSSGVPVSAGGNGKGAVLAPTSLSGGAISPTIGTHSPISLTTVGDRPVVLDTAAKALVTSDRRIPLSDVDGAQLQQPGPDDADVLMATRTHLWRIPLDGSAPTSVADGNGAVPANPVQVGSCSYGAWAAPSSPPMVEQCGTDRLKQFAVNGKGTDPEFRVNKGAVVLNDKAFGDSFVINNDGTVTTVDNWGDVKPDQETDDQTDKNSQSPSEADTTAATKVDCAKQGPDKPVAKPAKYTIRAGRSTILPLMDNVTPGNCSADEVSAVTALPAADGAVEPVNFGQDVQVTIPAGVSGTLPDLRYTVDDGVNKPTSASLSLTIAPASVQGQLKQLRASIVPVQQGGTVTYNVLPDWMSTTHDDLYLEDAKVDGDDSVSFTPDGNITFTDAGTTGTQTKSVAFEITDGVSDAKGTLKINVVQDNKELTASAVYAVSTVGVPTTAYPLKSVLTTTDQKLTLGAVAERSGGPKATATTNADGVGVTLSGSAPGIYYFTYAAVVADKKSTGVIRFDVAAVPATNEPPVATTDTVYLPEGSPVRIDPTANDVDPMGTGLAVAQVMPDSQGALSVTVDGMQTLTIAARGSLSTPTSLGYVVSNGVGKTTGEIRVVPVPPLANPPVPVAQNIAMKVRAGDALTIPIAQYAMDPRGEALTVALVQGQTTAVPGTLFVTQTEIRYLAPASAPGSTIKFSYTVTNTDGGTSAPADVTLTVVPLGNNSAPNAPAPILGRVFAGQQLTLPLPINGIDPDGDWVTLTDATSENHLGLPSVSTDGDGVLTYTALAGSGVDKVNYTVSDQFGLTATGLATILVVAKPALLQPPVAPNLTASLRPGKAVAIHILKQVSGDGIKFSATPFTAPAGWTVRVDGDALIVQADNHQAGAVVQLQYNVQDSRGLEATGTVNVTVSADAVLPPPGATDIFVTKQAVADNTNAKVNVTASVVNNTGAAADLTLMVAAPGTVTGARTVSIPLSASRQVVTYSVTDKNGGVGKAFIVVPPKKALVVPPNQPPAPTTTPTTKPTAPTSKSTTTTQADPPPTPLTVNVLKVNAGQTVQQPISGYVTVPAGKTAVIPDGASFSGSTQGHGARVDPGTFSYAANANGSGSDVLTFPVQEGNSAPIQLSIGIEVIPSMPTLSNYTMTVEAGGTPATLPLTGLLNPPDYPNAGQLQFAVTGGGNGFTVSLSGNTLSVTAASSVHQGTQVQLHVTASDSQHRTASGTVTVTATAKQMFTIPRIPGQTGQPGHATPVSVLPTGSFTDPIGKGLSVVPGSVKVVGAGSASGSDGTINVTPSKVGTIQVSYTVQDRSGDPTRTLAGSFSLTVKDVPGKPGTPRAQQVNATTLTVSWGVAAPNGSPPVTYSVLRSDGQAACAPTTVTNCTAKGLTAGKAYSFTVTAANALGQGSTSAASQSVTPNGTPDPPASPTVTLSAANEFTITWSVKNDSTRYSAITQVQLVRSDQKIIPVTLGETRYSDPGLDENLSYWYEVQVSNAVGGAAPKWITSAHSSPQHPNATPIAPTDLGMAFDPPTHSVKFSWQPSANQQYRPVDHYLVAYTINGSPSPNIQVGGGSSSGTTLSNAENQMDYRLVSVTPVGIFGAGAAADGSNVGAVEPFSRPGPASTPTVSGTGDDRILRITNTTPISLSYGSRVEEHWVNVSGRGWEPLNSGSHPDVRVDANGVTYSVEDEICLGQPSPVDKHEYSEADLCGDSATASGYAYGPLGDLQLNPTPTGDHVHFSWNIQSLANGRRIASSSYRIDTGGSGDATANAADSVSGYYLTSNLDINVTFAEGGVWHQSVQGVAPDNPNKSLQLTYGAWSSSTDGGRGASYCAANCHQMFVSGSGFKPGGAYTLHYWTDCAVSGTGSSQAEKDQCTAGASMPADYHDSSVQADGNGNISASDRWFGFQGASVWVIIDNISSANPNPCPWK